MELAPDTLPEGSLITLGTVDDRLVTPTLRVTWKARGRSAALLLTLVQGEGSLRCKPKTPAEVDFNGSGGIFAQWEVVPPPPQPPGADYDTLPTDAMATLALRNLGVSAARAATALSLDSSGATESPDMTDAMYLRARAGGWAGGASPALLVLRLAAATATSMTAPTAPVPSPAAAKLSCPGGCGYVVTWHPTHCCAMCAKGGAHGGRCERVSTAQQVPAVQQPVALSGTEAARSAVQWACPGGCGFLRTWHASHCCNACLQQPGQHGGRCEKKLPLSAPPPRYSPELALTSAEAATYARDGIVVLPSAVGKQAVDAARRAVNVRLSQLVSSSAPRADDGGAAITHDTGTQFAFADLIAAPRLHSALFSLIGDHSPRGAGQIAVNFPSRGQSQEEAWHVDGMRDGKLHPFTVLVCVALNDQSEDIGNFRVAKGSHVPITRATAEYYRTTGRFDNALDGESFATWKEQHGALPRFEPQPVLLRPGDAAIVHSKVAHRRGHNLSPDVRYLAIFRVRALAHDTQSSEQLAELFPTALYPGLAGLVNPQACD